MDRAAKVERKTKETDILVELQLDGGEIALDTGIGFFDQSKEQMLNRYKAVSHLLCFLFSLNERL